MEGEPEKENSEGERKEKERDIETYQLTERQLQEKKKGNKMR
jgi:hypothetical protein